MRLKLNQYVASLENIKEAEEYYFDQVQHLVLENTIDSDIRTVNKSSAVYTALEGVYNLAKEMRSAGTFEHRLINIITQLSVADTSHRPEQLIPSFEAHQTIALEDISSVLSNMITAIINFFKRIFHAIVNFFSGLFGFEKKIDEEKTELVKEIKLLTDKKPVVDVVDIYYAEEPSKVKEDDVVIRIDDYIHLINERQISSGDFSIMEMTSNAREVSNFLTLTNQFFILESERIFEELSKIKTYSDKIMNDDDFDQEDFNKFIIEINNNRKESAELFFKSSALITKYYQMESGANGYVLKKEKLPILMNGRINFNPDNNTRSYEFTESHVSSLNIPNIKNSIKLSLVDPNTLVTELESITSDNNSDMLKRHNVQLKLISQNTDGIISDLSKYAMHHKTTHGVDANKKIAALTIVVQEIRKYTNESAQLNMFLGKIVKHKFNTIQHSIRFIRTLVRKTYK